MKQTEFVSPIERLSENNRQPDQLADFLFQYGYQEPQLLEKENELIQQMINSIQSLERMIENLNIPNEEVTVIEWITPWEVAHTYKISLRTQYDWRKSGKLLFTTVQQRIFYNKHDLENLFLKGKNQGSQTI
jgi:hypothetical protein